MIQFAEEKNLLARLSVFGLFGDLQKYTDGVAVQLSSELMRQCVTNMVYSESNTQNAGFGEEANFMQDYGLTDNNRIQVCSNACWAIGEVAITCTNDNERAR